MPDNAHTLIGEVTDIFAHRFVIATKNGKYLADLGPAGAEQVALRAGDQVTLTGVMKPSELKVRTIRKAGGPSISLEHKKPHPLHPEPHEHADPKLALATVERNGFKVAAGPRRKPKHFEILGKDASGGFVELHLDLGGELRKTRPATQDDPKWADEIRNPA